MTVTINGVPTVRMKPFTKAGERLVPGATGVVPPGCYFAATPHTDGFDSRSAEIGFVCGRQVIGTGEPNLLTLFSPAVAARAEARRAGAACVRTCRSRGAP